MLIIYSTIQIPIPILLLGMEWNQQSAIQVGLAGDGDSELEVDWIMNYDTIQYHALFDTMLHRFAESIVGVYPTIAAQSPESTSFVLYKSNSFSMPLQPAVEWNGLT